MNVRQHRHHPQTLETGCKGHQHYSEVYMGTSEDVLRKPDDELTVIAEVVVFSNADRAQEIGTYLVNQPEVAAVGVVVSVISLN